MTTYPDYNLNSPYEINLEELKTNWSTLSNQEKNKNLGLKKQAIPNTSCIGKACFVIYLSLWVRCNASISLYPVDIPRKAEEQLVYIP